MQARVVTNVRGGRINSKDGLSKPYSTLHSPLSHVVFMRLSRTAASQSCQQERGLLWLAAVETKYLQKKSLLHLLCAGLHIAGISSPRFYYVIALRRILC